ncbi:ABC transporter permease [Rhizobium leguminosarum]|uniref:ABC transporter permease n=1 Tax=Rhizobium TaxID=379 RepID=UPI001030D9BD|nr:ABC transporter permease [Rhizobium leguminosarum]TBF70731.1 ABC transporter permease [Rhizobium leguminosarum]TBG93399.1 ABC transporter permease [Rhizobium leguminosarum]TBG95981.1 ABC transporter permease [Rhizobium leguminosarum]TBH28779.1 ABC transporter permease [Rhizobium leguminosarum]TBH59508.1 ABC transporter permease [Rhizobium leguminosarum]
MTNADIAAARRQKWIDRGERYGLLIAWIIVIVAFGLMRPTTFLSWANFSTIFGSQAVLVVLTLGLIVPLTAGDYDLSIAGNLTLSSMTIAVLNVYLGWPIVVAVLVALCIGLVIGAVNAFIVLYFRINSLIVTLGMGTFLHGITLWISGSNTISGIDFAITKAVIVTRLFGIPLAFYYALIVAAIIWYVFSFTAAGQRLLFVGRGREVARLSGIRVGQVRAATFLVSGFLGSLSGVLFVGSLGAADPNSGLSYLLPAFAAAFLGATSIVPGRFNPIGSVIAVYFLVTGITGLSILGISTFVQDLFYGGALVIAVCLSQLVRGRQERLS